MASEITHISALANEFVAEEILVGQEHQTSYHELICSVRRWFHRKYPEPVVFAALNEDWREVGVVLHGRSAFCAMVAWILQQPKIVEATSSTSNVGIVGIGVKTKQEEYYW